MNKGGLEFNIDGKPCGWLVYNDPKLKEGKYYITIFGADPCFIRLKTPV